MALEISKTFVVKAPLEAVWSFLTDPARVARCLPGAQITNKVDEQTYAGTITVKVGPVGATYKGTMRFDQLDPAARTATIVATGQDVRGKGGADMRMTSQLVRRTPGETEVRVSSQVTVMGILAQLGRGMIQDVSDQMFDKFVAAARADLEASSRSQSDEQTPTPNPATSTITVKDADGPGGGAPPIEMISFGSTVVARAAGRAARRPIVWIGAVFILLVVYWLWSR